jgi:hypothetical protein
VGGVVVRLVVVLAALGHVVVASFRGVGITGVVEASSSSSPRSRSARERQGKRVRVAGDGVGEWRRKRRERRRCWCRGGDHLRVTLAVTAVSVSGGDSSGLSCCSSSRGWSGAA